MAEPYPHGYRTGREPREQPTLGDADQPPRSDAGQDERLAPEHPERESEPLPPDHPSAGMIDEGGAHPPRDR